MPKRTITNVYSDEAGQASHRSIRNGNKRPNSFAISDVTKSPRFASAYTLDQTQSTVEQSYPTPQHDYVNTFQGDGMDSFDMNMHRFQSDQAMNRNVFMGPSHQHVNSYLSQYYPLGYHRNTQIAQYSNNSNLKFNPSVHLNQMRPFFHDPNRFIPAYAYHQFDPMFFTHAFAPNVSLPASHNRLPSTVPTLLSAPTKSTILNGDAHVHSTRRVEQLRKPYTAYNIFFSYDREIILALLPDLDTCNKSPFKMYLSNSSSVESEESVLEDDVIFYRNAIQNTKLSEEEVSKIMSTAEENSLKKLQNTLDCDKAKKTHKKSHGKIGFKTLSKLISSRWKESTEKDRFYLLAEEDRERYNKEMEARSIVSSYRA